MSRSRPEVLARAREALAENPRLSMAALAERLGMSRRSLYQVAGSREVLVREAGLEPGPTLRQRVVHAAALVLAERGVAGLSVDEAALRADVSRASAFGFFPGKGALFQELVRTYTPMDEMRRRLAQMPDAPPETVMVELAQSLLRMSPFGVGVMRAMLVELPLGPDGVEDGLGDTLAAYADLAAYLTRQMAAGRLTPTDPYLATQLFVGPILMHLFTRDRAARLLHVTLDDDHTAETFAAAWLRAMQPTGRTRRRSPTAHH